MRELVKEALKEINEELELKELENITDDTQLFELLDSMALLDLILEIESKLQDKYGKYIQIADETTMDATKTPFKTFKTLVEFLEGKING
jgi:acyl carrier protein